MDYCFQQEGWPSTHVPYSGEEIRPLLEMQHHLRWPDQELALSHQNACVSSAIFQAPPPQILVIDDSLVVRKIVEICHQRAGFVTKSVGDGVEALQWLSLSRAPIPPLIYLDIEMPRMDGYTVAHQLHARPDFSYTTLILLSGRDKVIDRLKGRLAGAKAYVTKPFKEQELLALTKSYLSAIQQPSVARHPCL